VPRDAGLGIRHGFDASGAALVTGALMLGVYAIVGAETHGWGSGRTLGLGLVAVALLAAFVWRENTAATPLLPLRVFRSRNVSGANLVQALLVSGALGMFFLAVLYLQRVLGYDALETGVAFLPVSLAIGLLSLGFSARLNLRFGARAVLVPGMVLVALGLAWLTRAPVDGAYAVDVLPAMLLLGIGAGVSFPALMTLGMSGASDADAGLASGLVNTTMQVGGALGIAVLATLASSRTDSLREAGSSAASALTGGYHLAFTVSAILAAVGAVVAATVLQRESVAHEEATEVALQTT
jgi:hypothetical protein